MSDVAYFRCPKCDESISGEAVVDPTWADRVRAHKATHERPTAGTLMSIAAERIVMDRRSGVPEDAIRWMLRDWLRGLIEYDVADAENVDPVYRILEGWPWLDDADGF